MLVGTTSVEKSELLSGLLKRSGVPHSVLNAKKHGDEAKVVALAGHKGAVTVATNMAGRGTDIMLGGSTEFLADQELRARGLDPVEDPEAYNTAWPAALEKITEQVKAEHDEVRDARRALRRSAPSGTSRGASTTSCVVVPAVRATRGSPGSTCRSATT